MPIHSKYELGSKIICHGQPAYIVGIQRGPTRYQKHSPYKMPIRYEVVRDPKKLSPDFIVDESQISALSTHTILEEV